MKAAKITILLAACTVSGWVAFPAVERIMADSCCAPAQSGSETKADGAFKTASADKKQDDASKAASADKKQDDAKIIKEQKPSYPLDTCVVLGGKLGEMGDAVDYVYKGRLLRFCCKGCVTTFDKDPAKYLAKLDEAVKAKAKSKQETPAKQPAEKSGASGGHAGHSQH